MKPSKWTKKREQSLVERARGQQNKSRIFTEVAKEMGLRPNSVRNFYYKFVGACDKKSFRAFSRGEVDNLLRAVILGTSRGESVRGICTNLAGGDKSTMLRYQNKYRTILAKNPERLNKVKVTLDKEGYIVKSPEQMSFLPSDTAKIITIPKVKPAIAREEKLTDTDIANLFMGFVRLVRKNNESMIDKLKKEIERLKSEESDTGH